MSKEDFEIFWPGTDIVKSRNNAFTPDHDGPHIDWAKEMVAAGNSAKCTASVERRRKDGTDTSTFRGMSRKADTASRPFGGAYSRAKPQGESKAARIREFLRSGPKDSLELGRLLGIPAKHARATLQYDVEQGNVVKLHDARPTKYALVGSV